MPILNLILTSDNTETKLPIVVSDSMPEDIVALIETMPIEFECKELEDGKALVTVTQQRRMKAFVKILNDNEDIDEDKINA